MSRAVKIFIISVCFIITANFASLSFLILVPTAAAETPAPTIIDIRDKLVVPLGSYNDIGEAKLVPCQQDATKKCWQIPWLAKYIGNMYRYGVVIGSLLAVMMIMVGGVLYLIGGLNPAMIARGKEYIAGAVTGLVLLLGSYVLLQTINPNLVNLKPIEVETIPEAKITSVKFCDELPAGQYDLTGDTSCGGKMTFKAKDTSVNDQGTCYGSICADTSKKCVPSTPTSIDSFLCKSVLIWGNVSDSEERYLRHVWLYSVDGNDVKDTIYDSGGKEDKGQKSYYIYREDITPDNMNIMNQRDVVMEIRLNDTGYEKEQLTYGATGAGMVTGVAGFFGAMIAAPDDYYVGRDPKSSKGGDKFTGIWINPKCETCGGAHPTKPGAKPNSGDGWMYDNNCAYFWGSKLVVGPGGIQIDINANNFREDSSIDCALSKMINPAGPKLAVMEACGQDSQCASGSCSTYKVGSVDLSKCQCKKNSDCANPTEQCITKYGTWNACQTCAIIGAPGDSSTCCSGNASGGICECSDAEDCPAGNTCNTSTSHPYSCVTGKATTTLNKDGDICTDDWECISDNCKEEPGWYASGSPTKECQCDPDHVARDCGPKQKCMVVESGCGWNYCAPEQYWMPSVPKGYTSDGDPQHGNTYGLCHRNADCIDRDCDGSWGYDGCDACKK